MLTAGKILHYRYW